MVKVWVQKGWEEFKDYYSVGHGHFVVFQYDGNRRFNVRIFNTTALEINYCKRYDFNRVNHVPRTQETGAYENRGENVVVDEGNCNQSKTSRVKLEKPSSHLDSQCFTPKIKKECIGQAMRRRDAPVERLATVVDKDTYISSQRAKALVSTKGLGNPICLLFMQPTYISSPHCIPSVPLGFARKLLDGSGSRENVVLRVAEGKSWKVMCKMGKCNAKLTTGWKEFVMLDGLKLGDVCVFEAEDANKLIWDVIIFPIMVNAILL